MRQRPGLSNRNHRGYNTAAIKLDGIPTKPNSVEWVAAADAIFEEERLMILKITAVIALIIMPLSAALWHSSHKHPAQYRFDLTVYKSLRVYLKDGVCGFRLLNLDTKTANVSSFHSTLSFDPTPQKASLLLRTGFEGPYRVTWFVFPFWLTTLGLLSVGFVPIIRGPVRQQWRRSKGLCMECGYNLRGNRSGRCSECGTRFR